MNTTGTDSLRLGVVIVALLCSAPAFAQQYRSESRTVSEDAAQEAAEQEFDPQEALASVTDPYARSLLLTELAARAQNEGKLESALKHLENAIALDALSQFAGSRLKRSAGLLAAKLGVDRKAIRYLAGVGEGADTEVLRQLAAAYAREQKWQDAGRTVTKLLSKGKKPKQDDRILAATVLAGSGEWRKVLPQTEALLDENARLTQAWVLRIRSQLELGQQLAALASRVAAWRLGVLVDAQQRLDLVAAFASAGLPLAAASLMEEGMRSGQIGREPEQLDQLAGLWLRAREYAEARPVLAGRLALAPSAEASLQLGQMELDAGNWDAAARHLRLGLNISGQERTAGVAMLLGQAEFQRGRMSAAMRAFKLAAKTRRYKAAAQQWVTYLESGQASAGAVAAQGVGQDAALRAGQGRIKGAGVKQSARSRVTGFTPVGAQAPGNADGRIPDWLGGLEPSDDPLVDPFPEDEPIVVIDASNMAEWQPWLSDGHQALLRNNPAFRMPVYKTRRSVAYPQAIYEATQKNRGRAKLIGSDALSGAKLGFPFSSPQNGVEAMWNHRVRWRGSAAARESRQAVVAADGDVRSILVQYEEFLARYAHLENPADLNRENILLYYLTTFSSGGVPDFVVLVHESANSLQKARAIWALPRTYKKMFRIPPVGYDNPFPGSEGIYFVDMVDMYNGAFDRYDWKLAGKRELLIGYNAFRAQQFAARDGAGGLLQPGAMNSDAARYEVHRVWVVEATERGGKNHSFGVRRFYIDEDSWNVVLVENYDRAGQMWRVQEGHLLPNRELQAADCAPVVTYDLQDGRYFINRMTEGARLARRLDPEPGIKNYRPANVKNKYSR